MKAHYEGNIDNPTHKMLSFIYLLRAMLKFAFVYSHDFQISLLCKDLVESNTEQIQLPMY